MTIVILSSSIIAASAIAGFLMLLSMRSASDLTSSAKAIFSADAGIEWELFRVFKDSTKSTPLFLNNATFTTVVDPASVQLDQSQILDDATVSADTGSQSFTVGNNINNIRATAVKFGGSIPGSYSILFNVRLATDGTLIGSTNATINLNTAPSIVNATFTPALSLNSNTQYSIEWQKDVLNSPTSSVLTVSYKTGNPYAGGDFSIAPGNDIYFQTFYSFDRKIKAVGRAGNVFRAFELRLAGATSTLP